MPIRIRCLCGYHALVEDRYAGQHLPCPECHRALVASAEEEPSADAEDPAAAERVSHSAWARSSEGQSSGWRAGNPETRHSGTGTPALYCPCCLHPIAFGDAACGRCGAVWGVPVEGEVPSFGLQASGFGRQTKKAPALDHEARSLKPEARNSELTTSEGMGRGEEAEPPASSLPPHAVRTDAPALDTYEPSAEARAADQGRGAVPSAELPGEGETPGGGRASLPASRGSRPPGASSGRSQQHLFGSVLVRGIAFAADFLVFLLLVQVVDAAGSALVPSWRDRLPIPATIESRENLFRQSWALAQDERYAAWTLFAAAVFILYHALFTWRSGATFGKRLMGLVVTRDLAYLPLTFAQALARAALTLVFAFTFFGVPLIAAALHARRQGLHDLLCRTVVIPRPVDWQDRLARRGGFNGRPE